MLTHIFMSSAHIRTYRQEQEQRICLPVLSLLAGPVPEEPKEPAGLALRDVGSMIRVMCFVQG